MAKENDIRGIGERYSFLDEKNLEEDLFRTEFGSMWNTALTSDAYAQSHPSLGISTEASRFDVEYGPIVTTSAPFAPYIAHHQSIKLTAKPSVYPENCIECGYHDDVREALSSNGTDFMSSEYLNQTPTSIMSLIPNSAYYSSMEGIITTAPVTFSTFSATEAAVLKTMSDCYYGVTTPLNEEDVSLSAYSKAKSRIDLIMAGASTSFEYGDYVNKLEEVILNLSEEDIPNLYMLMYRASAHESGITETPLFKQGIEYLQGKACPEISAAIEKISTGFREFIVSADNSVLMKEMHAYKDYFSLRGETSFPTTVQATVADNLKSVNLDCRLLRWMVESSAEADMVPTGITFDRLQENTSKITMVSDSLTVPINIKAYDLFKFCGDSDYPGDDMKSVLVAPQEDIAFIGLEDSSTRMAKASGLELSMGLSFSHTIFSNQMKNILMTYNRSFQNVASGKGPYSETLAYRISKYKKSEMFAGETLGPTSDQVEIIKRVMENNTQPTQNVWLSNSSESEMIEYVDTQMKYDENYVIIVWAYNLVLGTRHFYSNLRTSESPKIERSSAIATIGARDETEVFLGLTSSDSISNFEESGWTIENTIQPEPLAGTEFYTFTTSDSITLDIEDDCEAAFTATTMPMATIREVPFFIWPGSIIDKPPVVPDVNIVPIEGNSTELIMLLNNSAGTTFAKPIAIYAEDEVVFERIKESQALYTGLVEFGTDNKTDSYEVYRVTTTPRSYSDFAGNLLETVSTVYDQRTGKSANSAIYSAIQELNIKYYYVFRSVDIHGHFSNPTSVFEVELVTDGNFVEVLVDTYEMEPEDNHDESKSLMSTLHVVPRITQAIVNEEASGLVGDTATVVSKISKPILGVEEESVWGKTFKIRLVSRKTKKKLDINVTFGTEHIEGEIEETCSNSAGLPS